MIIPSRVFDEICRHLEQTYPEEGCGFLLGRMGDGPTVEAQLAIFNRRAPDGLARRRYLIGPDDVRHAERAARVRGLQLLGVYHSHPDVAAQPSDYDREHAWPWLQYLIVSVRNGSAGEARAWQLRDDRSAFFEHAVSVAREASSK